MIQLCYISTARAGTGWGHVDEILAQSRRNNSAAQVTGLLLFNGKRFLQLLEGETDPVEATYARIKADSRHYALVRLSERQIDDREFGRWNMAYERMPEAAIQAAFLSRVAELTRTASPNVKALFGSYAAI